MFALYTTPLSANGRKPLALARELGLEPEIRHVNVYRGEGRKAEFLAVSPLGKIPVLVDGSLTLSESNAILIYLAERQGGSRLWSEEPRARAEILRWLFWEASAWQPALSALLAPCVGHRLLPDVVPALPSPPDWRDPAIASLLALLDDELAGREFLCGAAISIADFSVAGMTTYFRHAGFPSRNWPALSRWIRRVESLDSWRASADPVWT